MGGGVLFSASTVMGLSLVNLVRSEPHRDVALLHLAVRDSCLLGHLNSEMDVIKRDWDACCKAAATRAHRRGANS